MTAVDRCRRRGAERAGPGARALASEESEEDFNRIDGVTLHRRYGGSSVPRQKKNKCDACRNAGCAQRTAGRQAGHCKKICGCKVDIGPILTPHPLSSLFRPLYTYIRARHFSSPLYTHFGVDDRKKRTLSTLHPLRRLWTTLYPLSSEHRHSLPTSMVTTDKVREQSGESARNSTPLHQDVKVEEARRAIPLRRRDREEG
ncbi:hypothetical protein THAOC_20935 [Thalassiosira oceanica]|uniref:Uncharacterized protein n=1 Tax=Thalassiosira oceanica TaxID=159749 RepID=K0SD76_THAOC|nr:hypothetical protein THAOC_20935 [Thalassiosira oceanica]|eukprot:EJK58901.1 hypothetical protein THAOC_20935 [Thalassiosira oceanica]